MNYDTEAVLSRLRGLKRTGQGKWVACCPAHGDKSPSLAIRDTGDRLLLHCFAGCAAVDVVHAIGLEMRDLFAEGYESDPMAFARVERAKEDGRQREIDRCRMVLAMGYADRKAGKRLSAADMESERKAFDLLKKAGVEASPEVCYFDMMARAGVSP